MNGSRSFGNVNRTNFVSNGAGFNGNRFNNFNGNNFSGHRGYGYGGRNPYNGYHRGWYNGNWGGYGGFGYGWGYPFGYGFGGGLASVLATGWGWGSATVAMATVVMAATAVMAATVGSATGCRAGSTVRRCMGMATLRTSNPYYASYAAAGVASMPYDYSQPINTVSAAPAEPVTEDATALFSSARDSFKQGNYEVALQQANDALAKTPNDTALHEFRGLCLFALGRYDEAAVDPVRRARGRTGLGLADDDRPLSERRRLHGPAPVRSRRICKANPQSATSRFVLAYHYVTEGYLEEAAKVLRQVVALKPSDTISAKLLEQIEAAQQNKPGAEAAASAAGPGQHHTARRRDDLGHLERPAGCRHLDRPDDPARRGVHLAGHPEGPDPAVRGRLHLRRRRPHAGPGQRHGPGRSRELERSGPHDLPHHRR